MYQVDVMQLFSRWLVSAIKSHPQFHSPRLMRDVWDVNFNAFGHLYRVHIQAVGLK